MAGRKARGLVAQAEYAKYALTGVEQFNAIKDLAEHCYLSRHSSRQFELDNIGLL
jgi:hypothetical protein